MNPEFLSWLFARMQLTREDLREDEERYINNQTEENYKRMLSTEKQMFIYIEIVEKLQELRLLP